MKYFHHYYKASQVLSLFYTTGRINVFTHMPDAFIISHSKNLSNAFVSRLDFSPKQILTLGSDLLTITFGVT